MENPTAKRFNLIDAMVLVAATAAGFALGRAVAGSHFQPINDIVAAYAVSVALMWTLAILALNLTRYRTTLQRLAGRPGFTAAVAIVVDRASVVIYSTIIGTTSAYLAFLTPPHSIAEVPAWLWVMFVRDLNDVRYDRSYSGVVAAVWLVSAMAGCWRAEKTWIDRIGRFLRVFWLLVSAGYWLSLWIFPPQLIPLPTPVLPVPPPPSFEAPLSPSEVTPPPLPPSPSATQKSR